MVDQITIDTILQIMITAAIGGWAYVGKKGIDKVEVIADKLDKVSERLSRLEERVAFHQQFTFGRDTE